MDRSSLDYYALDCIDYGRPCPVEPGLLAKALGGADLGTAEEVAEATHRLRDSGLVVWSKSIFRLAADGWTPTHEGIDIIHGVPPVPSQFHRYADLRGDALRLAIAIDDLESAHRQVDMLRDRIASLRERLARTVDRETAVLTETEERLASLPGARTRS